MNSNRLSGYHLFRRTATFVMLAILLPCLSLSAAAIEDEDCLACHEGTDASLNHSAHRLSSQVQNPSATVTCTSCHEGGDVHVDDPSADNITNPAASSDFDTRTGCFQCHVAHVELDDYGRDVHADQGIGCSNCHRIHATRDGSPLDNGSGYCYECHSNTHNDIGGRSDHPIADGVVTCLDCHKFYMQSEQNVIFDLRGTCRSCHPQQAGPFAFEHAVVIGYAVEGDGCRECHKAHGSENDFLLTQPEDHLCKQCHFPSGHTTAHGGAYANVACLTCHTEVHGSYTSNLFLDANLPGQFGSNCYNAGCHSLIQ